MNEIYIYVQLIGVAISLVSVFILMVEKTTHNQKYMVVYVICMFMYNLGYLFELKAGNVNEALFAVKLQYTGSSYGPMLYAVYVFKHCRVKIPRKIVAFMVTLDTFILMLVYTTEFQTLYYTDYGFVVENGFAHMTISRGIFYYVRMVESWVPLLVAFGILIMRYRQCRGGTRADKTRRIKYICLIGTTLIPLIAFVVYFVKVFGYYDPTPLSTVAISICMVIISYRFKLFDILSSAQVTTINNMGDGFVVVDENYNYVFSNGAANKLIPELGLYEKGDKLKCENIALVDIFQKENNTELKINDRYYEFHITKLTDSSPERKDLIGYTAVIFDITQMQNYIDELAELRVQADKANEAKSTFLASMSHEIRTPMNAIVGMTELILRDDINNTVEENATGIQNAAKSLLSIINDILDFSKIESQKMEIINAPYDFAPLMNDIINMINVRLAEKSLKFIVKIDPTIPAKLIGDEIRIKQILINILNNSVKFTNTGYIELVINYTKLEDRFNINVAVTDTGVGMTKENIKRLFSSFQRFDSRKNRTVEGTGLGLAITKRLLDLMGGDITVTSTYGEGSTFYLTIPQDIEDLTPCGFDGTHLGSPKKITEHEHFAASFTAPKVSVLIVDDNAVNLKVATGLLRPYKVNTATAASGRECLRLMELYTYDLILMDYMMPEMNGIDTLRVIRNVDDDYHKNVPVIVLTADAVGEAKENFLKQGFDDYLSKPIDIKMLESVLKKHIPKSLMEDPVYSETELLRNDIDFILEGVDIVKGLINCGNDLQQYLQILAVVHCYGGKKCEKIRELRDSGDIENFTIEAHSLKSSAANIGASAISEMARELEMAGKRGDTEYINDNTEEMLVRFEKLLKQIESVLKQKNLLECETSAPEEKLTMAENEQLRYFFDMLELIDSRDEESASDVTKVLEMFDISDETKAVLKEIRKYLEDSETRLEARELVQKYIDKNRSIVKNQ